MRYSKMFSQGKRNDINEELKMPENPRNIRKTQTCGHDVHKLKSRDKIGIEYNLNGRSVARYLRVYEIIPELKNRLDDGEIILEVAGELSYFFKVEQQDVEKLLFENRSNVDKNKAKTLCSYSKSNKQNEKIPGNKENHLFSGQRL